MLSRELIVDACAVINLLHGDIAQPCLENIDPRSQVTPAVEKECSGKSATAARFRALIDAGMLHQRPEEISADDLLAFMSQHELGAGESEAILACQQAARHLWSDDRKARNVATELLGQMSVTGTLGILLKLVCVGDITPTDAHRAYCMMRAAGGRLPPKTLADFIAGNALA